MRRFHPVTAALLLLLLAGCSQPAVRQGPGRGVYGTVIGSISVGLDRGPRSAWDGILEDDLATLKPDFVFHFANAQRPWSTPTERVRARIGEIRPFVISLRPGRASLEELELSIYDGPAAWPLGLISATDGKRLPIALEFTVDPDRITYIGRIHVRVPRRLQLFNSKARFKVEDASEEDRASMRTLIELSRLPIETVLARRSDVD
jgi:hypothetical protein